MAARDEIIAHLDDLLEIGAFEDLGPNGLQVPGPQVVERVVTGVTAQLELFERAAAERAQLVLCHHGLFWDFHPRSLTPAMKRRLETLFQADISLAAYHLPLDAHPDVGNNALIVDALGLERSEPFGEVRGRAIGWIGRSAAGIAWEDLRQRCGEVFGQDPLVFDCGPDTIHSIGVISGAAASDFRTAIAAGLDAFITGEPAEHVMADAREAGVHFVAGGHYATETLGVRRLGDLLEERFGIDHVFVDVPNPI